MTGYNAALEAETFGLFDTLFAIGNRPKLTAEPDLTDNERIITHGNILKALNKRYRNGKIGRRLIKPKPADDIDVGVAVAKKVARALLKHGEQH